MTAPFYQQIESLHQALTEEQLGRLREFLSTHDAMEFYEAMVSPTEGTDEERDAAAITQGFAISQHVPDDAWHEFEVILGPDLYARFEAAIEVVKQQFIGLFT